MTQDNLKWLEAMRKKHIPNPGRILDVGSYNVNGEARSVFPGSDFIGIDMREGPGVDKVMNAHDLLTVFELRSFDVIICMNMLEHDRDFGDTLAKMHSLLKTGGFLIIVTPTFNFGIHRHPKDYWRFGEDAYREVIFNPEYYELLDLEEQYTKIIDGKGLNPCICAIGKKI